MNVAELKIKDVLVHIRTERRYQIIDTTPANTAFPIGVKFLNKSVGIGRISAFDLVDYKKEVIGNEIQAVAERIWYIAHQNRVESSTEDRQAFISSVVKELVRDAVETERTKVKNEMKSKIQGLIEGI